MNSPLILFFLLNTSFLLWNLDTLSDAECYPVSFWLFNSWFSYFIYSSTRHLALFSSFLSLELDGTISPYPVLFIQPWKAVVSDPSGVFVVTSGKVSWGEKLQAQQKFQTLAWICKVFCDNAFSHRFWTAWKFRPDNCFSPRLPG